MNNTGQKPNNQRKIRVDRIVLTALFLIIILSFFLLIINSINKSKDENSKPDSLSTGDSVLQSTGRIEFEKVFFDHKEINKGNLLLINSTHEYLPADDEISLLENIDKSKSDYYMLKNIEMKANKNVIKAFNNMINGYYAQTSDTSIMVTNAFITEEHQNMMYNQALINGREILKGGCSEHQTGLALDLGIHPKNKDKASEISENAILWLKDNCAKYGFIFRYSDDKKAITGVSDHTEHLRYVGIPHAFYITSNDLTLEEYIEELKKYTYGHKSLSFTCFSKEYEIYYIKAKEGVDDVDVYVPTTNSYTISGNNTDGFIITVER